MSFMAVDSYPYWMKPPSPKVLERLKKIAALVRGSKRTVRNIAYALYPNLHGKELDNAYNVTIKDVVRCRIMGLIPWSAIKESRCTFTNEKGHKDLDAFYKWWENFDLTDHYELTRKPAHTRKILVWFEKETVQDEIGGVCDRYHIPWVCGRGQATWSIKERMSKFLNSEWTLVYLGDNDEKGREIYQVIKRDLKHMNCHCKFEWAGITDEQEEELGIPEESRLDGMELDVLEELVESIVLENIDKDILAEIEEEEEKHMEILKGKIIKIIDKE